MEIAEAHAHTTMRRCDDAVLLSLRVALFAFVRVFQFAPEAFPPPPFFLAVTLAQSNKHVQLEKKL